MTEDEMVGWHHRLSGHEFQQTPEHSEEQESLVFCSPWGCKESDTMEQLNNSNHTWTHMLMHIHSCKCRQFSHIRTCTPTLSLALEYTHSHTHDGKSYTLTHIHRLTPRVYRPTSTQSSSHNLTLTHIFMAHSRMDTHPQVPSHSGTHAYAPGAGPRPTPTGGLAARGSWG